MDKAQKKRSREEDDQEADQARREEDYQARLEEVVRRRTRREARLHAFDEERAGRKTRKEAREEAREERERRMREEREATLHAFDEERAGRKTRKEAREEAREERERRMREEREWMMRAERERRMREEARRAREELDRREMRRMREEAHRAREEIDRRERRRIREEAHRAREELDRRPVDLSESDSDENDESKGSTLTPRTEYYNTIKSTALHMADSELFQVNYNSRDQFRKYVNLTKTRRRKNDCGYQTLFALGLLHVKPAKKGAKKANRTQRGVDIEALEKMLASNFDGDIKLTDAPLHVVEIIAFLGQHLREGYATFIVLPHHAIVAYNHEGVVYYYDPQQNKPIQLNPHENFWYFRNISEERKVFTPVSCGLT